MGRSFGLGRRKASVARVWVTLSEGEGGVFFINKKRMIDYFVRDFHQNEVSSKTSGRARFRRLCAPIFLRKTCRVYLRDPLL